MTDTSNATDATAAPGAQPGNVIDPYRSYTFNLLIANIIAAHFTEVRGLGMRVDRIAYREAGLNSVVRQVPGQVSYSPVELLYGVTIERTLFDWIGQVQAGNVQREEVSVALLDPMSAAEVMRWNLSRAWPCEWRGAPLSTSSHELAIETLVLAHEGITRLP